MQGDCQHAWLGQRCRAWQILPLSINARRSPRAKLPLLTLQGPHLPPLRQMRAQLAAMAVPVRLVAGHDLYREAEDASSFFILQEGEWHLAMSSSLDCCLQLFVRGLAWMRRQPS